MTDNKKLRGPADARLIDFHDRKEVMRACHAMRVDELHLVLAHNAIGINSRKWLRAYLSGAKKHLAEYRRVWRAQERRERQMRKAHPKARIVIDGKSYKVLRYRQDGLTEMEVEMQPVKKRKAARKRGRK